MYDRPGEGDLGEGVDGSYKEIFTDYTNGIDHLSKDYYQSFGTFAAAMQQSKTFDANNQMSFANVLYPDMTDGIGQRIDINYLKNRSMTKSYMNFNVGFGSLATNP
jgi:hypothetical protein